MTWELFSKSKKRTKESGIIVDKEYEDIFYENRKCMLAGLSLRARNCPMYECK